MTENTYSLPVAETIGIAWNKTQGSKGSIWAAFGLLLLFSFAFGVAAAIGKSISPGLENFVNFIAQIVNFLLEMGLMYIGIRHAAGQPISYTMMFYPFSAPRIAIRLICVYILICLCMLPFILLGIIPTALLLGSASPATYVFLSLCYIAVAVGIVFITFRLFLSVAFVLDQNQGAWASIKLSYQTTRSNVWRLLALMIIQICIFIISLIPLLLGLIWTIPFMYVLYGVIYKRLTQRI